LNLFIENLNFNQIDIQSHEEENLHKIILLNEEIIMNIHDNGKQSEASEIFSKNYSYFLTLILTKISSDRNIR